MLASEQSCETEVAKGEQLEELLAEAKEEHRQLQEEMREAAENMEDENRQSLAAAEEEAEEKLTELEGMQRGEVKGLKEEFEKDREELAQKLELIEGKYDELVIKYEGRESRPEDLATIAELERRLEVAEQEVGRVQEEMKYFKLELQNREQNFNKTFGGGPNVGVMQVGGGAMNAMRTAGNTVQAVNKIQRGGKANRVAVPSLPAVGRPGSGSRPPSGGRKGSR